MSCNNDFGAGQNIDFYLITTGLDVNPANGTVAKTNYEYLKTIISSDSDIMYEVPQLREITNVNYSMYLDAYDTAPRSLYQALFGVAQYNNPWSNRLMEETINKAGIFPKLKPNNGEFSINPYELYEKGIGLYKCIQTSPGQRGWVEMGDFKITEEMPGPNDGYNKSVWGVQGNGTIQLYVKNAFSWTALEEYVASQNSTLTVSKAQPSLVLGNYWFKITDLTFYEYTDDDWAPGEVIPFNQGITSNPSEIDRIFIYANSSLELYNYVSSKYKKQRISRYVIRSTTLNTIFDNSVTENFIVEDGCIALLGGLVSHLFDGDDSMVHVYHDGIYVGDYTGIDFKNVTVHESDTLDGTVEIIHTQLQPGEGLSLQLVDLTVDTNNQTEFSVPDNMVEFVELTVNGVANYSVTFDLATYTITYDPVDAGYELDPDDSVTLAFLY